jgi:sulfur carrier protein ThiS
MFLLTGCFQISTTVKVNPDGSGTVEECMLLSKKMMAQIKEMMQGLAGEAGEKQKPLEMFEPDKLKAQASTMGAGVIYQSASKVETADYTGYRAVYAFADINKLRLSQQSDSPLGGSKSETLPLTFHFTKGSPGSLTIVQPHPAATTKTPEAPAAEEAPKASAVEAPAPPAQSPAQDPAAEQFLEMLKGMKMAVAVEVNGTIVSTNASHRAGNRLTIIDFDLARLGSAGPGLEKLAQLNGRSLQDATELLRQIPGLTMELNDRVTVVFNK